MFVQTVVRSRIFGAMATALLLLVSVEGRLVAQPWKLAKEKDGISIYTRQETNSSCKAFRGVTDVHSDIHKLFAIVDDVNNTDDWDPNIKLLKVLSVGKDSSFSYYLVYGTPWPLHDRDLCVQVKVIRDPETGWITLDSQSEPNLVPEVPGVVRIRNYWQKWILQPLDTDHIHLVLEGFADPGGNIPAWLSNMALTETPFRMLWDIRKRVE
jgi:hypothetical protein